LVRHQYGKTISQSASNARRTREETIDAQGCPVGLGKWANRSRRLSRFQLLPGDCGHSRVTMVLCDRAEQTCLGERAVEVRTKCPCSASNKFVSFSAGKRRKSAGRMPRKNSPGLPFLAPIASQDGPSVSALQETSTGTSKHFLGANHITACRSRGLTRTRPGFTPWGDPRCHSSRSVVASQLPGATAPVW
jgi:hypothetical protein